MLSLHIGVFNPSLIHTASPYPGDKVFLKGFQKNGYDTKYFDYRATFDCNKELQLLELETEPDVIWFGKCERITEETMKFLRTKYKNAIFCKWAADVRYMPTEHDSMHCKYIDWFFGTFGGDYLKAHLVKGMKGVCSILTFTDSDFYRPIDYDNKYESNVLWTGHRSSGDNLLRNQIIDSLYRDTLRADMGHFVKMLGLTNWVGTPEYNAYITGTKIGIGCNSFKRTKYSSDRLGNYMSIGTFFLTEYIDGLDDCFKDNVHLSYFKDVDEMWKKIEYYLEHEDERNEIAKKGQTLVHKYFDSKPLVENILKVIKTNKKNYSWDDIYTL